MLNGSSSRSSRRLSLSKNGQGQKEDLGFLFFSDQFFCLVLRGPFVGGTDVKWPHPPITKRLTTAVNRKVAHGKSRGNDDRSIGWHEKKPPGSLFSELVKFGKKKVGKVAVRSFSPVKLALDGRPFSSFGSYQRQ